MELVELVEPMVKLTAKIAVRIVVSLVGHFRIKPSIRNEDPPLAECTEESSVKMKSKQVHPICREDLIEIA